VNRRSFFKALAAVSAAFALPASAIQALAATAPRWQREVYFDLERDRWAVYYKVYLGAGAEEWYWAGSFGHVKPTEALLATLDRTALTAFQRAGVL